MQSFGLKRLIGRILEEKDKGAKNLLLFLLSRILRYSRFCYLFTIDLAGSKLQFSPLAVPTSLFVLGDLEPETTYFLQNHLKKGDVYIDIGANVGTTTLIAAKAVGDTGVVICFEPNEKTYKALMANIKLNGLSNVLAKRCALGSKEGSVLFSNKNNDDMNRVSIGGEGNTVPLSTLDSYTRNINSIKLLKIDVEGYEIEVLRGSIQTLKKTEMVFFESIEQNAQNYGFSIQSLIAFLQSQNFRIVGIDFITEYLGMEDPSSYPFNLVAIRNGENSKLRA